jgi:hypothetical protein
MLQNKLKNTKSGDESQRTLREEESRLPLFHAPEGAKSEKTACFAI